MYKWLKSKTFSNSHSTIFVLFVAVAESKDKTHGLKISGNLFRRACLVFWQIENFHENFYFLIIFTFCCNLFPVIIYLKPAHHYFLLKKKHIFFLTTLEIIQIAMSPSFLIFDLLQHTQYKEKINHLHLHTHSCVSSVVPPSPPGSCPRPLCKRKLKKTQPFTNNKLDQNSDHF